jgi:O-antigen ligase
MAVAFVLAFSRWGTNIGISPLFITDVLIGFSVVNLVLTNSTKGVRPVTGWVPRSAPTLLFSVFMAFVVLRFLFSLSNGPLLDWVRDAVPFLYGFLAFLAARSLATSDSSTRAATVRLFWWAINTHLVWCAFVVLSGTAEGFRVPLPIFVVPFFEVRPDIDAALVAVAVGMLLRNILLKRHVVWSTAGLALGIVTVLNLGTRAGLISVALALAAAFVLTFASTDQKHPRRTAMIFAIPFIVAIAVTVLPATTPGQRLIATIDPSQAFSAAQQSAQGTQRARELTWSTVVDWTNEEPVRQIIGSGFGNDFLAESGTKAFLEGTTYTNVRSPHNWFVGIYARMGTIGLVLTLGVIVQVAWIVWTNRRRIGEEPLLSMAVLIMVAILPVATLGVVLESPFGAVPFFWAMGTIMCLSPSTRSPARQSALQELRATQG